MNDFQQCLTFSHSAEDLPFWKECYSKAFPNMQGMLNHRQDGDHQRQGIDRSIILSNSKQILIDEKVRGRNKITGKVYSDIALERWSNLERKVPGWVVKPLLCDYIAYAIAPLGLCYLLPVIQLQAAWISNEKEWERLGPIDAKNNGYTTRSHPVKVDELFRSIGKLLRINFSPFEIES